MPVGFGTDGGDSDAKHKDNFSDTAPYMPTHPSERSLTIETGRTLLHRVFRKASPGSLTLLLISSIKVSPLACITYSPHSSVILIHGQDAALFLRDNTKLFKDRVKEVVIMGGVQYPVEGEFLIPDTAANNQFDPEAAAYFYRRCQELCVPLVIVSRLAAYTCPVPRQIYDDLAQTGEMMPRITRMHNDERVMGAHWSVHRHEHFAGAPSYEPTVWGALCRCTLSPSHTDCQALASGSG